MLNPTVWLQPTPPPPPPPHPSEDRSVGGARATLRVLVVDDERLIADTLSAILDDSGFTASAAYSGEEALEAARTLQPDVVISDVLMPKMTGVELGIRLRQECPQSRVILFSGQAATSELLLKAQAEGHTFELFPKPIHPEELIAKLKARW
ncbi:MAG: response regulator [Acidobacteriota bacterium]